MKKLVKHLSVLLADTYALYLKTQNYHWHVTGINFKAIHELFETEYRELAEAVDAIAERIRILGSRAPATFREYDSLKTLKDGDSGASAEQMLEELAEDNQTLIKVLNETLKIAEEAGDEGTVVLLGDRIAAHEKAHWMLAASKK
ncbi:DNA starvation/stationary phase protection protein [Legionella geestiana]|uniref:Dps family protein n=1 Tax=Legionella geestiana TaxID=45065 RepID=UPI001092EF15|nr:DNA starvation/stationary phase protection protein [Legionella geestiana]QDQ39131.1 DNA starvation/stationary phase protection protein [Legionella geestiana]